MVGERHERRVIMLTVDERPTSEKVLDWAITNMYRVSPHLGDCSRPAAAVGARHCSCFEPAAAISGLFKALKKSQSS